MPAKPKADASPGCSPLAAFVSHASAVLPDTPGAACAISAAGPSPDHLTPRSQASPTRSARVGIPGLQACRSVPDRLRGTRISCPGPHRRQLAARCRAIAPNTSCSPWTPPRPGDDASPTPRPNGPDQTGCAVTPRSPPAGLVLGASAG